MSFSVQSVGLCERFSKRADTASAQPLGIPVLAVIGLFVEMYPAVKAMFEACTTQPPVPPPVPSALTAIGVTGESWTEANGLKFAAEKSSGNFQEGFSRIAVMNTTREIAKSKKIRKKEARPLAIAALKTARDENVEELAFAIYQSKANSAQFQ